MRYLERMFEDWKRVWREAVENFKAELEDSPPDAALGAGSSRQSAMRRDLAAARAELARVEADLQRTRDAARQERDSEAQCLRRQTLAANISDEETARLAGAFAARHAERATLLERKIDVLDAERAMRLQDLHEMEHALNEFEASQVGAHSSEAGAAPGSGVHTSETTTRSRVVIEDDEFVTRKMQREARERAADARLEELKRRMETS